MKSVLYCRRTFIAIVAIGCLTAMAFINNVDTSMAIATVAVGLSAANSFAEANKKKSIVE